VVKMSDIKLFALTGDERGALKMLINTEIGRLRRQTPPQNETMIVMFQNILFELKNGRPLS
jgi:hypothetical protein